MIFSGFRVMVVMCVTVSRGEDDDGEMEAEDVRFFMSYHIITYYAI